MPRPTTKAALLAAMQTEHTALEALIADLTPDELERSSPLTKWAIKDVLAHLFEWEQMCLGWYKAGLRGKEPPLPAEGYNWAQLPALNKSIYQKYRGQPLEYVLKHFRASYRQMLKAVQGMDEADLFTRGRYAWTKKNALSAYVIGATSSHYNWARKEIKKCLK